MEKFNNIHVKVNSKSNYRNLNGKFVKVLQFLGTLIYVEFEENGEKRTCDFNLSEIVEIRNF